MGNAVTTDDLDYTFEYSVIPDFANILILPFVMTSTLIGLLFGKRLKKQRPHRNKK
jgi:hypothetical protein